MVIALSSFVIALFVTMVLIPPLMASAQRLQVIDLPDPRKVHATPTPRVGGIAMVAGTALPTIMWLTGNPMVTAYMLGAACILGFGVWDDRRTLDFRIKFAGQLLATLIVVVFGGVVVRHMPFTGPDGWPDYIAYPFTVFALIGVTNAINLADGLDGLAGGTTLISVVAVTALAYMAGDEALVLLGLAVTGSVFGFLRFNTYPARVFMGDAGSQFLGFSLGVLVIVLTQKSNTVLSPAIALFLLGLPIIDTVLVMSQRVREGRSPFSPDNNHIHHKLLQVGLDHYAAVLAIYLVQALLVTAAYFLRYHTDSAVLGLYFSLFVAVLVAFHLVARWRPEPLPALPTPSIITRLARGARESDLFGRGAVWIITLVVALCAAAAVNAARQCPRDIWLLASGMLSFVLVAWLLFRGRPFGISERAAMYVTGSLVVYLLQARDAALPEVLGPALNAGFVLMAIAIALAFRFSRERTFRVTPLDFLVIFIALVIPNLPGLGFDEPWLGETIAKMIVMFYASEYLATRLDSRSDVMRYSMMATLALIVVAGA